MVGVRVVAAEVFDDVAAVDKIFELGHSFGEVDFAGYDGVQPAFDDVPYPLRWIKSDWGWSYGLEVVGMGHTLKDPGGFVN